MPGQVEVPDAGKVAEVLGHLSKEANPFPSFSDQSQADESLPRTAIIDINGLVASLDVILVKFRDSLNPQQRRKFQYINIALLRQSICDLQAKQCKERRQQGLKRLEPFLDRFAQFEQLLNKFCEAEAFTAFIWVSVR